jgi:beta-hydroxylase
MELTRDDRLRLEPERYDAAADSFVVRLGKHARWPINRFLARQSTIGAGPFFEESEVPGIAVLRENWEAIRDEARALLADRGAVPPLGEISPDHRHIARTSAWKSFFFTGYGYQARQNRARCPRTAALIDRVPNVIVAFYSIFDPGTHLREHRGVTKAMLNVHLPLIVPGGSGRCEIRIGGRLRRWTPGEFLIFDDTFRHEAWNESREPRVVLLVQVARPMRWPGRLVGRLFMWSVKRSRFVQDVRRALAAS